jgi:hypothetical protein
MADYYPLIARAVDGLSDRSPDLRRAVYERARTALIEQLRSLDPPLPEEDIERERLSLDDAIRRVEEENAPAPTKPPAVSSPAVPSQAVPPEAAPTVAASRAVSARAGPAAAGLRNEFSDLDERRPEAGAPIRLPALPVPDPVYDDSPLQEQAFEDYFPEAEPAYDEPAAPARPRVDSRSPSVRPGGRGRAMILGGILALVIGAIAVAAWLLRDNPADVSGEPPLAAAPPRPAEGGGKIAERVGGELPLQPQAAPAAGPSPTARQEVSVAQRAVFYEEDPATPQTPKTLVGRVVWRLEGVNAGQGQPLETAVRAVVEIADAGLVMNMLIRRNLDASLPASHTMELSFSTRSGEAGRVIRDVGLLQFKNEEGARGTPVAGLPVPVRENLFLIGLSNLSGDVERNVELLLRRNWVDLPVRMASGQRAILSFEKGVVGEQVLNDAFRQWQ